MSLTQVKYERTSHVAPLGLRFWDAALNAPVMAGLVVTAHPVGNPARAVAASVSPSGLYGFAHLPGLRELEHGRGDADFWQQSLAKRRYVISVSDPAGCFHACTFEIEAPRKVKAFALGTWNWNCSELSPPADPDAPAPTVPLFSTPVRAMPPTLAVVRADLQDADTKQPAAWAVLSVRHGPTVLTQGMADADGKAALFFGYPILDLPSPSLWQASWLVSVTARYSRWAVVPRAPDVCQVLDQKPATLLLNLSPPTPLPIVTLKFGQELVLKSQDLSELWVRPAP